MLVSFFGFAVVMIGNDVERKLIESENLKAKKIEKKLKTKEIQTK